MGEDRETRSLSPKRRRDLFAVARQHESIPVDAANPKGRGLGHQDLTEFDPEATNLNLLVNTIDKLDIAVW